MNTVYQILSTFEVGITNKDVEKKLLYTNSFESFINETTDDQIEKFLIMFRLRTNYKIHKVIDLINTIKKANLEI